MSEEASIHHRGPGVSLNDSDSDDMGTSNQEPYPEIKIEQNLISRCFWLGKIYFDSILAERIFHEAVGAMRSDSLDENLMAARSEFPYSKVIEKLAPLLKRSVGEIKTYGSGPFNHVATMIGLTLNESDTDLRRQMLSLIRSRGSSTTAFEVPGESSMLSPPSTPPHTSSQTEGDVYNRTPILIENKGDIAKYSMALEEYCTKKGTRATCDVVNITLTPSLFRATLRLPGLTFSGEGPNKKVAKHVCSKQACEMLEIPI